MGIYLHIHAENSTFAEENVKQKEQRKMTEKIERQKALQQIIQEKAFRNQGELLSVLKKEGFDVAQPTLSRDLKQMKVSKVYDKDGKYFYVIPGVATMKYVSGDKKPKERLTQSFGFLGLTFSGDIAVVKTLHGYANSLAAEIDDRDCNEILGSLAGDDTVLLVLKEGSNRQIVYELMKEIIPHFEEEEEK